MDPITYGRMVEHGGHATGGIILGLDLSCTDATGFVAYDPATGIVLGWDYVAARAAGQDQIRRWADASRVRPAAAAEAHRAAWREFYEAGAILHGTG